MQECYLNALIASPPEVLGRRLKHLSCYHCLMLTAVESPFVTGGERNLDDLALAVWICSRTMDEIREQMPDPRTPARCKRWGMFMVIIGLKFLEELSRFESYLDEYLKFPGVWSSQKPDEPLVPQRIDWFIALPWFLISKGGFSETEAWNMSVGRAMTYRAAQDVAEGSNAIMSDIEAELEKMIDEAQKVANGSC